MGCVHRSATLIGFLLLAAGGWAAEPPVAPPHDEVACAACHPGGTAHAEPVTCVTAGCHSPQDTGFFQSEHDLAHRADDAPTCVDCHGGHALRSGADALETACQERLDRSCLGCHPADQYVPGQDGAPLPTGLSASIHAGPTLGEGCPAVSMSCFGCHGPHGVMPADDPASRIHRDRIAETCGACHVEALAAFEESIHGRRLAAGSPFAPTCINCHGVHGIQAATGEAAMTSVGRVVFTCAECHEDPAVTRGTDLHGGVVESYERTFHGLAYAHGVTDVATCVSCHGAHDVLPSGDPEARTHPSRIESTCAGCHGQVDPDTIATVSHPSEWPGLWGALKSLTLYFPVARTALNPLLVSGMGALVGFLSGLFGVGGGFLMTPLLIFIGIPAAVAAATDAAQITAGASSGALSHARIGNVDFKMGLIIVAGGWTGGIAGVQLVALLRHLGNFDFYLKAVYVLVLGFIGTAMFLEGVRTLRGKAPSGEPKPGRLASLFKRLPLQTHFPKSGLTTSALLPVGAGFLVGVLAAFLGVGGGFIMLPAMIYVIGIPTRVAIGTDLFQIVLTSANVALQQAITNHTVDVLLAVTLFAGSVIGARFGVMASRRLRGEQIRVFLAIIVLVVMGALLYQLLVTPAFLIDFARSGGGH
jgi:uncharacterized membrane protein YfcA